MKPLSEFYKMKGMRDGYRNECKACGLRITPDQYAAKLQWMWDADDPKEFPRVRLAIGGEPRRMAG
jgi:hypothetical protein